MKFHPIRSHSWKSLLAGLTGLLLGLALMPGPMWGQDDPRAREIMQKVSDRDDGDNATAEMEMVLIDKRKKQRVRKIRSFSRDVGKDTQSIMFFLTPADVKNTGFLTYDYDESGKDDDQWLFLPALRKTKRIASDDKSGSFMGSDFNYSDMSSPDLEEYDYSLVKEDKVGGVATWVIKSVPRSREIMDKIGYGESLAWVRQDNYVVIRGIRKVYKSRKVRYFQIKKLEQIDGIWVAVEMQMTTKQGKTTLHTTRLKQRSVRFNQDLSADMFTVRRLEKGL